MNSAEGNKNRGNPVYSVHPVHDTDVGFWRQTKLRSLWRSAGRLEIPPTYHVPCLVSRAERLEVG